MISRTAGLVFHEGAQITSQSNGGLGISAMTTATAAVMSLAAGFQQIAARQLEGLSLSTYNGVDQWFTTMNTATGAWSMPSSISVTTTATVATLKFGDGTTMTTAATSGTSFDQTLNTTSNVTFGGVVVNGTLEANTIRKAGYPALANMEIQGNLTPQTSGQSDLGAGPSGANKQFGYVYANTGTFSAVEFTDSTRQTTAAVNGQTSVYARNALPTGITGRIITVSDSGSDTNSPAGNYAPAYWDPDASVWTYIGNSNSVTPI